MTEGDSESNDLPPEPMCNVPLHPAVPPPPGAIICNIHYHPMYPELMGNSVGPLSMPICTVPDHPPVSDEIRNQRHSIDIERGRRGDKSIITYFWFFISMIESILLVAVQRGETSEFPEPRRWHRTQFAAAMQHTRSPSTFYCSLVNSFVLIVIHYPNIHVMGLFDERFYSNFFVICATIPITRDWLVDALPNPTATCPHTVRHCLRHLNSFLISYSFFKSNYVTPPFVFNSPDE